MIFPEDLAAPPASSVVDVPPLPAGWQPINHAILANGTLAVMATDVDLTAERQRLEESDAAYPPSRLRALAETGTAQIWTLTLSEWTLGPTFPLEATFAFFDRFSDSSWIVVGAPGLGAANARVISSEGAVINRFSLGRGIKEVMIDAANRIWVTWLDEGIYGNDDWNAAGQGSPPSTNGVACFYPSGAVAFIPQWPDIPGAVVECYSLNVSHSGVWVCPYTDFPIVQFIENKPSRWWQNPLRGCTAIAVDGSLVLLAGGYFSQENRMALLVLDQNARCEFSGEIARWALPLRRLNTTKKGEYEPVWECPTLLVGRRDTLHLIDAGVWYRWRVADTVPK